MLPWRTYGTKQMGIIYAWCQPRLVPATTLVPLCWLGLPRYFGRGYRRAACYTIVQRTVRTPADMSVVAYIRAVIPDYFGRGTHGAHTRLYENRSVYTSFFAMVRRSWFARCVVSHTKCCCATLPLSLRRVAQRGSRCLCPSHPPCCGFLKWCECLVGS